MKPLRILHLVESYFPAKGGMSVVVQSLSERMVRAGHDVHVFTRWDSRRSDSDLRGVKIESFKISGNKVHGIIAESAEIDRFQKRAIEGAFDVVVIFAAQQWSCDLMLDYLDKISAKKIFVPTGFSGLKVRDYQEYFHKMKSWLFGFDEIICLSQEYQDYHFISRAFSDQTTLQFKKIPRLRIIPNAADEFEFNGQKSSEFRMKLNIPSADKVVLHIGSFTGLKGQFRAMLIFALASVDQSSLFLIGNSVYEKDFKRCQRLARALRILTYKRIEILDVDRPTTVAAFKEADVFLFPSLVECSPLVLFECLAAGLPFLASDAGNSREIASLSSAGEIMESKTGKSGERLVKIFSAAKKLRELLKNSEKRQKYSIQGRQSFVAHFSWEKISQKYLEVYSGVAQ